MIEITDFRKEYRGFVAVDSLNLTIEKGSIYGFVGPNGAGKTTTIRFLATLLRPTRGSARINGFDVATRPRDVRQSIGFMPDQYGVYDGMKVWQYLDFFAVCYGLEARKRKTIINDVLELVDLSHKRDVNVEGLSRGMLQRLCLAKTLLHDPPVLILDEPASGLDPRARIEIKELLKELSRMGKTIVISSHILSELADLCSHIGIIERGKLLVSGKMSEIYKQIRSCTVLELRMAGETGQAQMVLSRDSRVRKLASEDHTLRFEFTGEESQQAEVLKELIDGGVPVVAFRELEPNLEELFMTVTKGEVG